MGNILTNHRRCANCTSESASFSPSSTPEILIDAIPRALHHEPPRLDDRPVLNADLSCRMLEDPSYASIVRWGDEGDSFVVLEVSSPVGMGGRDLLGLTRRMISLV